MSYDIYIGQAVVRSDFDKKYEEFYAEWVVEPQSLIGAPVFPNDGMTSNGNSRHPGYSQWSGFLDKCGLHDLFFNKEEGLMREHPGIALLKPSHLERVREALAKWKLTASGKPPGFGSFPKFIDGEWKSVDEDTYDSILARLLWLEFWMDWALRECECEIPAVYNH